MLHICLCESGERSECGTREKVMRFVVKNEQSVFLFPLKTIHFKRWDFPLDDFVFVRNIYETKCEFKHFLDVATRNVDSKQNKNKPKKGKQQKRK